MREAGRRAGCRFGRAPLAGPTKQLPTPPPRPQAKLPEVVMAARAAATAAPAPVKKAKQEAAKDAKVQAKPMPAQVKEL